MGQTRHERPTKYYPREFPHGAPPALHIVRSLHRANSGACRGVHNSGLPRVSSQNNHAIHEFLSTDALARSRWLAERVEPVDVKAFAAAGLFCSETLLTIPPYRSGFSTSTVVGRVWGWPTARLHPAGRTSTVSKDGLHLLGSDHMVNPARGRCCGCEARSFELRHKKTGVGHEPRTTRLSYRTVQALHNTVKIALWRWWSHTGPSSVKHS